MPDTLTESNANALLHTGDSGCHMEKSSEASDDLYFPKMVHFQESNIGAAHEKPLGRLNCKKYMKEMADSL